MSLCDITRCHIVMSCCIQKHFRQQTVATYTIFQQLVHSLSPVLLEGCKKPEHLLHVYTASMREGYRSQAKLPVKVCLAQLCKTLQW